jgi:hypothetical protein
MTNEQLGVALEVCRAGRDVGSARVSLWEKWVDGELDAQRKGRE